MQVKSQHKPIIRAKRSVPLRGPAADNPSSLETILKIAREFEALPPETWKNTPRDLAKNVDHYLYGLPKVDEE